MINETSVASAMFEYRFSDSVVLSGHVLGNLMLKALDNLSVRPLDAVNLIRTLLNVDAHLLPMTEFATVLCALDEYGHLIHGEMNIDKLKKMPQKIMLKPSVE